MKKIYLMSLLMLIIFIVLLYIPNTTYAANSIDEFIEQGDTFMQVTSGRDVLDEYDLEETSSTIYNILFAIAVVIAFIVGSVIGIQFIVASVDEKAKIKETLIPYVVGVFVVFSAFGIWKMAVNIGKSVVPEGAQLGHYEMVMEVSLEEIDNMTREEIIEYYDNVLMAIEEQLAYGDKEKTEKKRNNLNERKQYVENKMNDFKPGYEFWKEYRGKETDEQAYTRMINTSVNSMKESFEIQQFMAIITQAKVYFASIEDTQKVSKLEELYGKFKQRYDYVRGQEMAGLEIEDTEETSSDDEIIGGNGYTFTITNTGNFEVMWEGFYRDESTDTGLSVDIIKGTADEYLNDIELFGEPEEDKNKTIKVDNVEFQCRYFKYPGVVEYYMCYQIDEETLYTVELDSTETDEAALMRNISGFLTPNIQKQ